MVARCVSRFRCFFLFFFFSFDGFGANSRLSLWKTMNFKNDLHDAIHPYTYSEVNSGRREEAGRLHNPKTKWFVYIYILRKNFHKCVKPFNGNDKQRNIYLTFRYIKSTIKLAMVRGSVNRLNWARYWEKKNVMVREKFIVNNDHYYFYVSPFLSVFLSNSAAITFLYFRLLRTAVSFVSLTPFLLFFSFPSVCYVRGNLFVEYIKKANYRKVHSCA